MTYWIKWKLPYWSGFRQQSPLNHIIPFGNADTFIYRIYVDNYIIYYVIIDDDPNNLVMEIRRFLYNGQNQKKMV